MKLFPMLLTVLASTQILQADSITTKVALEIDFKDLKEPLVWISDSHLRTAALYESIAGYEPTGDTAKPRNLFTETIVNGKFIYTVDPIKITDCTGRIQLDLENIPGGILYGGFGAYTVINLGVFNLGVNCGKIEYPELKTNEVPEPTALVLLATGLFLLRFLIFKRKF